MLETTAPIYREVGGRVIWLVLSVGPIMVFSDILKCRKLIFALALNKIKLLHSYLIIK